MAKDTLPQKSKTSAAPAKRSAASDIANFLKTASTINPDASGRLIFSLDATMSRQPTWDRACQIQASMFESTSKKSGLAVQLIYFRGFGECRASKWVMNAKALANLMTTIQCRGGQTQIAKVLSHAAKETSKKPVAALVFIGDAMEEDIDRLCHLAGELGVKGVKAFMFLEGRDSVAERAFREIARLSGGAFMRLGEGSAKDLEELLSAVAAYASGGRKALETRSGQKSRLLLEQLRG